LIKNSDISIASAADSNPDSAIATFAVILFSMLYKGPVSVLSISTHSAFVLVLIINVAGEGFWKRRTRTCSHKSAVITLNAS